MKEDPKANDALNTMPSIQFKLEDGIKSQLKHLISEFFSAYSHFGPWDRGDYYFEPQGAASDSFSNYRYEFFMRNMKWSDDMVNDVANCFLQQMLDRFSDLDIQVRMADDMRVLLNDDMSKRWLSRIAKAERTSVAYERSMRLIGDGENIYHNVIACEILQKAADDGDAMCVMYLIDKHCNQVKDTMETVPSPQCARGVVYEEIGDISTAKTILQEAADNGDTESAMYLIFRTIFQNVKKDNHMETSKNDITKRYEGLSINWSDEKIFDFLLKRYDAGDARAKQLLEQHLKNFIDTQVGDSGNKFELRKQKINETKRGYPLTVIQGVLNSDYCNEQKAVNSKYATAFGDDDDNDLPF